jgi:hypothetical protein
VQLASTQVVAPHPCSSYVPQGGPLSLAEAAGQEAITGATTAGDTTAAVAGSFEVSQVSCSIFSMYGRWKSVLRTSNSNFRQTLSGACKHSKWEANVMDTGLTKHCCGITLMDGMSPDNEPCALPVQALHTCRANKQTEIFLL